MSEQTVIRCDFCSVSADWSDMAPGTAPDGWRILCITEETDTGEPADAGPWRADICPKHNDVPLARLLGKALK